MVIKKPRITRHKRIKLSLSDRVFEVVMLAFIFLVLCIALYPLVYVLSSSLSDPVMVHTRQVWLLPKGFTLEGYQRVLQDPEIWSGYRNTIFYTVLGTLVNLFVTLTCAYPLSRKDCRYRNFFAAIFTFTMFFSGGLIPTYLLVRDLGLYNTIGAMILPGAASIYNIIIARTYFQTSIPYELVEAAKIDGCSEPYIFLRIYLPLSSAIIAVLALFYAVGHWNSYFNALIYLSDRASYPLQLILREILIQSESSLAMMSSGDEIEAYLEQLRLSDQLKFSVMIISSAPMLAIYPFLQKFFVKGVMIGAVKG